MFLHVSVILSTISGGRRNTYSGQAGGTHPTGMLSCLHCSLKIMFEGGVAFAECEPTTI